MNKTIISWRYIQILTGLLILLVLPFQSSIATPGEASRIDIGQLPVSPYNNQQLFSATDAETRELLQNRDLVQIINEAIWKPISDISDVPRSLEADSWFKFTLYNSTSRLQDLFIEYNFHRIPEIDVYIIENGLVVEHFLTGNIHPFSSRPVDNRNYLFPLTMEAGQETTVIIRVTKRPRYLIERLSIKNQQQLLNEPNYGEWFDWFIFGGFLIIIVYTLIVYSATRLPTFLLFAIYTLFVLTYYIAIEGYGFQLLWPDSVFLELRIERIASIIVFSLSGFITYTFLQLQRTSPRTGKLILFISSLMLISALLAFIDVDYNRYIHIAIMAISAPFTLLLFITSLRLRNSDITGARLFSVAWGIRLLSTIYFSIEISLYGRYIGLYREVGDLLPIIILAVAFSSRIQDLRTRQQLAQSESNAKSSFMAKMSHEIRTPMNGILGMSELLKDTPLNKVQQQYNELIYSSGKSLLTIINDILDYSKIEAGKLEIENIRLDVQQLVNDVVMLFQSQATEKNLSLNCTIHPSVPQWIIGDPSRIRQVLINLLSNAIKFTEKGSVSVSVTSRGQRLHFAVIDTGKGIPGDLQLNLFESFTQADNSIAREFGGTGLGLTISRELVQLMKGKLGFASELGKGSNFWFNIPCIIGTEAADKQPSSLLPGSGPAAKALSILVAEDNPTNQLVIKTMLEKLGHQCTMAENGEITLSTYQSAKGGVDLILMDCEMPVMDGYQSCRLIRQWEESQKLTATPIIALTAHSLPEQIQMCLDAGMNDHLSKPITRSMLEDKLMEVASSLA